MVRETSKVLFASAVPERMDVDCTLPAKFNRLMAKLGIKDVAAGRTVAIKMHVGGNIGYSTIHPLFVKLLVDHISAGKPKRVFITDGDIGSAASRGYALQTVGAELVPLCGTDWKAVKRLPTGWPLLGHALVGKEIMKAEVLVNFSHVKGHGDCGFGGACKNLAMGCVPPETRRDLHQLEGAIVWKKAKCTRCWKCIDVCPTKANSFNDKGEYTIFWHDCKMCQHCVLACPVKAIDIPARTFVPFQEGLARVARLVMEQFDSRNVFHVNVLTHITPYCDCWGLTTPAMVPDIGIMASRDIVAVEQASLDSIKVGNLIPGSIPPPLKLRKGRHLFEKLHARDPYLQIRFLEKLGCGTSKYELEKVK